MNIKRTLISHIQLTGKFDQIEKAYNFIKNRGYHVVYKAMRVTKTGVADPKHYILHAEKELPVKRKKKV